jgi:hypothetical protein
MIQIRNSKQLYDQDILLWVEDTVAKLRAGDFANLDMEHLIEEVEALGISQKKELLSRLVVLLAHLLKRLYVDSGRDYNGWERTIRNQRSELQVLLQAVPSLKTRWDMSFDKAWEIALKSVRKEYPRTSFPDNWSYSRSLAEMIDRDFWSED